ncbi:MAG: helix-turn-helix transcriptional regulator [Mogibacterium sp.]|nr:helix-turn-helix transcriptional regulator [Mogibacterium sp.]
MIKKENNLKINKEKAKHGDIFLPVNSYHCLIPFTYRELALHWHEEMEITLIQDGTSDYKVGQEVFEANAGDIILIPPYCTHSACEIPGKTMISDSMVFHPDYLGANNQDLSASKYLRPMAEGQLQMQEVIRHDDAGYAEIKVGFLRALDCFKNKPPFYEMLLKENLLQILILLFSYGYIRESCDSHITSENRRHIKSALEYITDHYSEKISISEMAQLAGFSENYFMSLFRQYVGMSCIQYINHYRIQKAAHALEETTKSVSEIAMIHGFDNISYFNLQFRKTFGMTPREFRNKRN